MKITRFLFLLLVLGLTCISDVYSSNTNKIKLPKNWLYQLQNANPDEIITSGYRIVVMDYSRDGTDSKKYDPDKIKNLKKASIIPLCYLSIGEAENYRNYWRSEWITNSKWLGKENPDWEGNYKVKYWHAEWQSIIFSYLDQIIEQGFSGIYLDIIDAFEYWNEESAPDTRLSEEDSAQKMMDFVKKLSIYAKNKAGDDFLIFPQNGERLLDFDHDGSYLRSISGQAVEDVWYDETTPQPKNEVKERLHYLKKLVRKNKMVLAVEYVDDGSGYRGANKARIDDIISKCKKRRFYCYIANTDRELNSINIIPTIQP